VPLVLAWALLVALVARGDPILGLMVGIGLGGAFIWGLLGVGGLATRPIDGI
jgi:hypothetical protein